MTKNKVYIVLLCVVILFFSSCELVYNKNVKQGKVWFVGYGADFNHDPDPEQEDERKAADLLYTVQDAIEVGKAFKALAKKANVDFEDAYFLGNNQYDLKGKSNVFDCSWDTYSSGVESFLSETKDEDIIIFFYSSHGDGSINKEYSSSDSFNKNTILFYEPNLVEGVPTYVPGATLNYKEKTFKEVFNLIDGFKGTKFVLCDTCFSGSFIVGDGVTVNEDIYKNLPINFLFNVDIHQSSSVWVLSACTLNQQSTEVQKFKHGGFTHYVLEALGWNEEAEKIEDIKAKEGKVLTAGSIASYVYSNGGNYKYDTWKKKFGTGNAQTPVFSAGSSDIILFKF